MFHGNFSQLCEIITASWVNFERPAEGQEKILQLIDQKDFIPFDNGYLTAFNSEEFSNSDERLHFKVSTGALDVFMAFWKDMGRITVGLETESEWQKTIFKDGFDLLDNVIVIPVREIAAFGTVLEKGKPYILPAIGVYKLFKDDTRQAISISTELTLNAAACLVGAEAIGSTSVVATVMEVVDVSLYTFATYANAAPELAQDHPEITAQVDRIAFSYSPDWILGARWIGMSDEEIANAEKRNNISFTPEHREFLRILHTIDRRECDDDPGEDGLCLETDFFYNWLQPAADLEEHISYPYHNLLVDVVEGNRYGHITWKKAWGPMPTDAEERKAVFTEIYNKAPRIIPVYKHRGQVADMSLQDRPVLSMMGQDIIVYGWTFQDYLLHELEGNILLPDDKYMSADNKIYLKDSIPFWRDFL